jgi:hypothetical protein
VDGGTLPSIWGYDGHPALSIVADL